MFVVGEMLLCNDIMARGREKQSCTALELRMQRKGIIALKRHNDLRINLDQFADTVGTRQDDAIPGLNRCRLVVADVCDVSRVTRYDIEWNSRHWRILYSFVAIGLAGSRRIASMVPTRAFVTNG